MKLSIVIPAYNAEKYIMRMINCILNSKCDFEIVCVNDGSTDNTLNILNGINDSRVKVFSKQNEGPYKTWQFGVKHSQGDYITILDADDYIDEDYIEYIFNFIEKINADVLFTPYYIETIEGEKKYSKLPLDEGLYKDEALDSIRNCLISGRIPYGKPTKVIRRYLLVDQINNSYNERLKDFEDWLTMIQIFSKAKSLFVLNKPYYHYIQYPNSISRNSISYRGSYESLISVVNYLSHNNYVQLSVEQIQSIKFYGLRSVLLRCIKIKELSLANEIMRNTDFKDYAKKSSISRKEKLIYSISSTRFLYLLYKIKSCFGK